MIIFRISPERVNGDVGHGPRPWYVGWSVCHPPVMDALSALVTLPPFLARYEMIGNLWVFVGSPGYGAHLHLDDDLDTNTWQAQVWGNILISMRKIIILAELINMISDKVLKCSHMNLDKRRQDVDS